MSISYPVIDMGKTGQNIKRLREERNISVSAMQEYLGMESGQAIYRWQKGVSLPTVDHLCALSHLLCVPMEDILVLQEPRRGDVSGMNSKMGMSTAMNNRIVLMAS